ncbi:hypothetical protein AK812_SmicGene15094, partial [Symbiodinium microadriaticum]
MPATPRRAAAVMAAAAARIGRGGLSECFTPRPPIVLRTVPACRSVGARPGPARRSFQSDCSGLLERSLQELGNSLSVEVNPDSPATSSTRPKPGTGAALLGSPNPLPPQSRVFVNMVKTTVDHFQEVAATSRSLSAAGYRPVPHVPVSRISTMDEFQQTLEMLRQAGATEMLLIGGNDIRERQ